MRNPYDSRDYLRETVREGTWSCALRRGCPGPDKEKERDRQRERMRQGAGRTPARGFSSICCYGLNVRIPSTIDILKA